MREPARTHASSSRACHNRVLACVCVCVCVRFLRTRCAHMSPHNRHTRVGKTHLLRRKHTACAAQALANARQHASAPQKQRPPAHACPSSDLRAQLNMRVFLHMRGLLAKLSRPRRARSFTHVPAQHALTHTRQAGKLARAQQKRNPTRATKVA